MTMSSGYQHASNAYKSVAMTGADPHTVMLKSLQYIVRKLEEAKKFRAENNFEEGFHCHEKIFRVISALENGLPDTASLDDEETRNATMFLAGFYNNLRNNLITASAKPNWEEIYTQLIDAVRGLHSHMFKNTDAASGMRSDVQVTGIDVTN